MHYTQIIHGSFNKSKSNYLQLISRTLTGLKEWGGYSLNWRWEVVQTLEREVLQPASSINLEVAVCFFIDR